MILTKLYKEFFNSEKAGGLILLALTIFSLAWANSPWQHTYLDFRNFQLGGHNIVYWINDGLMTIFFLLIGLELEREIFKGELSNPRNTLLPIFAATGGMLLPAGIYLILNLGTNTMAGAGIPIATDIAFALGVLSLLGKRVPASLKIFLTALAVIDDLGAILVISIFYSSALSFTYLIAALVIFCLLILLNRLNVKYLLPYLVGGIIMWYFMSASGIHPTITGVLLAFAIPFKDRNENSPSYRIQHILHKPVAFLILPLFALANTGITIDDSLVSGLTQSYSLGIIIGLIVGKPLGIVLFTYLCVRMRLSNLPTDLNWKYIVAIGFLGGIGFTMSIFIGILAFDFPRMIETSKIAVFMGSLIAGLIGFLLLKMNLSEHIIEQG